jgi:hypothetical protein
MCVATGRRNTPRVCAANQRSWTSTKNKTHLRSGGHISNLIKRCERTFGEEATLLASLDAALATLRA